MSLRVLQHHLHQSGLPATSRGGNGPFRAVACHDTEGETGEQGAWNTLSWMIATAAARNASYHEVWAFDEAAGELLAIVAIPFTHASHSIAPQPFDLETGKRLYDPDAQVRAALGDRVHDPNMWVYAVSIAGKVADCTRYARNASFVAAARQRLGQLQAAGVNTAALLEHARFNPHTRSDWGQSLVAALTSTRMEDDEMATPTLRFKPEMWTTLVDAALFEQAVTSAAVVATIPMGTSVATVGESADNVWRLCVAGDPERLLFVQRRQLSPAVPGGDPALVRHVADAFNGVRHFTQAELDAAIAAIPRSVSDAPPLEVRPRDDQVFGLPEDRRVEEGVEHQSAFGLDEHDDAPPPGQDWGESEAVLEDWQHGMRGRGGDSRADGSDGEAQGHPG